MRASGGDGECSASRAMNANGRMHAGVMDANGRAHAGAMNMNGCAHPEDFWAVEPDPLLGEAANSEEDEGVRAHLELVEPANPLDKPQRFGGFRIQGRGAATAHGQGHVQGQMAHTKTVDRGAAGRSGEGRHLWP